MISTANSLLSDARTHRASDRSRLKRKTHELLAMEVGFVADRDLRATTPTAVRRMMQDALDTCGQSAVSDQPALRNMAAHLRSLCMAPLLSPAEEQTLFRAMNYAKYRANSTRSTLNPKRPSAKKISEIETLLEKAEIIRNRIIHSNIRLVISIAKQFVDDQNSFDDLLSEGISCLVKAVEKFDCGRGFRFSTYATRAICRELFRLVKRGHRDRQRFSTGVTESLGQGTPLNRRKARSEGAWNSVDESLSEMIDQLDEREQYIVRARYGFERSEQKPTFQFLGSQLGISKERVRQLEQRALRKLREIAGGFRLEPSF